MRMSAFIASDRPMPHRDAVDAREHRLLSHSTRTGEGEMIRGVIALACPASGCRLGRRLFSIAVLVQVEARAECVTVSGER